MNLNRRFLLAVPFALVALGLLAGGDGLWPSYAPKEAVAGEFSATGPDTMEVVMKRWIAAFREVHPGAKIHFNVTTSDSRDRTALGPDTDEVFESTGEAFAKKYHYDPLHFMVSLATFNTPQRVQALGIFVHPSNPIAGLTLAQLDRIYGPQGRGNRAREIKTWGDLGLTGEWAARPVHAYSRQLDNEVTTHLRDVVARGAKLGGQVVVPGKGVSVDVVGAVAADPGGIGFAGFAYQSAGVRAVPLARDEGGAFIAATTESCAQNRYPLVRPLCFFVNRRPGAPLDPLLREFIRFVLSAEGQRIVADEKYLPLTPALLAAERAKID